MGIVRLSSLLLLLFLQFCESAPPRKGDPFSIRISCGARQNTQTPSGTFWYKDFAYTGGRLANATRSSYIVPPLKTLRYFPPSDGPENCYNVRNIPNGHYQVRVFFALVDDHNFEKEPMFDVSVEGTQIYTLKSGWSSSDDKSFAESLVFISDNSVSSCFHSTGRGDPSILSIEILQVDDNAYNFGPLWGKGTILRTAKRLTCGSGRSAFDEDYDGDNWGGDRIWTSIKTFGQSSDQAISTENNITHVSISPNFYPMKLYQTAIVGTDSQPDLSFNIDVDPNKNYSIWLHFAEVDPRITAEGKRVFDVLINGDIAFQNVDVIHMTRAPNAALVLNKTIALTGRTLTITIHPMNGSHAIINAIEIFEIIAMESKTAAEEVRVLQTLKNSLGLPLRFGWNGDPCVPQQHPWSGADCQFIDGSWVIDGLGLDNQGLRGVLPNEISRLRHLQTINLSGNSIHGSIPSSLGLIAGLQILDLSYNLLNGSIPESLGQLSSLHILNLNGNSLSGKVPSALGGRPLHGASFNFTGNAGLCGVPGLPACGPQLSIRDKVGIGFGGLIAILLMLVCLTCWWKRRQNILRAQKIASGREAPYAKARTQFVRDVQMTRPYRVHDKSPTCESAPPLLS
ncbi:putative LRR receptor-like serine/threonine-protein kinase [Acorus gramineus]|uniref:LRR receptor-like serine/threonine-protein kinase n=1 Tax=Acorus gramineus TaxID=55184 RepID=A0AAV9BP70_ACOGR|nr:putative LRR receptor-like serine/threonine-protein kinase [Acorus gramineus]